LQRSAVANGPAIAPPIMQDVLRSPGQPLDSATRAFMEPRFGHDFSGVRVHTDAQAAESARSVNALAYTVGSNVVFGAGQYAPGTVAGQRLLAHELTHVVQQAASVASVQEKPAVSDAGDSSEQEAEQAAEAVVGGRAVGSISQRAALLSSTIQRLEGPCEDIQTEHRLLIQGSVHPAVREAQRKLNLFHTQQQAAGQPGLTDAPLVPDCIFGQKTSNAVKSFQEHVFPKQPKEQDRIIGDKTWAELDKVIESQVSPTPTPTLPVPPTPTPSSASLCSAVPTTTPSTCSERNKAYCEAGKCFPSNPWLACVCRASGEVCRAVDAFTFSGTEGKGLKTCIVGEHSSDPISGTFSLEFTKKKGEWFLSTNQCIWGHWRAAFESIHDPSRPVPNSLTPEWASAVSICRSSGIGSAECCRAHVNAEQKAIDICEAYNSAVNGKLPSDVPFSPACSSIVASFVPPPPFTGDFGKVADRITYGNNRCCS
jgi:hypothetical protein